MIDANLVGKVGVYLHTHTHNVFSLFLTSLCQTILGLGNPVALQARLTVESFFTLRFFPVFTTEMEGGTETNK